MSGTSLDGVDLAYCEFRFDKQWKFDIHFTKTYHYSLKWQELLSNISDIEEKYLDSVHRDLGEYYGRLIQSFCEEYELIPDFIASHGHTVFHEPDKGVTLQIGSAEQMSRVTKTTVINDFRSRDVKLGGQGAPLVPVGDHLLFSDYEACLNLGGFSNISFQQKDDLIAYDICPANMPLNRLVIPIGKTYDKDGELARSGEVNKKLLAQLNALAYYKTHPPKSLGVEWFNAHFYPLINNADIALADRLCTVTEHIAMQIALATDFMDHGTMLITGGGAHNQFLVERIIEHCKLDIEIPEDEIVDFKEALIFAFLGVLRYENKINVYKSVTGASQDHCSGVIHNP